MTDRDAMLERERKWATPVGIAAIASIVLVVVAAFIGAAAAGDGQAEALRNADANQSAVILSSIIQALAFCLWIPVLVYLFLATRGRSDRMKANLVGAAVIAPIFLAASYVLGGLTTLDGAESFVADMVPGSGDRADDLAQDAIDNSSMQEVTLGLGFGGRIGLAFVLIYTCLNAMRSGLLTRFWGSLGMAVGALMFFTPILAIVWFVYMGLLIMGAVPGGRPPAWAAGKAIPWPTPGEKMAEELEAPARPVPAEDPEDGKDRWGADYDSDDDAPEPNPPRQRGERRKRKRRD